MGWPLLPDDVVDWIRMIMQAANEHVTERIVNQPNVREVSLDDALIDKIAQFSAPKRLPSGAVVMLQVHNIGGLRQFGRWELADIAFLVHVSVNGQPFDQKIGLLQSKRLYPDNYDVDVDDPLGFRLGMNGLLQPDVSNALSLMNRQYKFQDTSTYAAIKCPDEQLERIDEFHKKFGEAVYYLMYNPSTVPFETKLPASNYQSVSFPVEGARVVTSQTVSDALPQDGKGFKGPSFGSIKRVADDEYWRLETWVADLLLRCKVGRPYSSADEELIESLIVRRSGPIGAAVRINVELPEDKIRD